MRIVLADDQPEVLSALRFLLEQEEDTEVVGEVTSASSLVEIVSTLRPDVVLVDWELPGLEPGALLATARSLPMRAAVVALSGRPEAKRLAMTAGVDAFVSKGDPPEHLTDTLCHLTRTTLTSRKPPLDNRPHSA